MLVEDVWWLVWLVVVYELEWVGAIAQLVLICKGVDRLWAYSPGAWLLLLLEVLRILALVIWRYELADSSSTCAKAPLGFSISFLSSQLVVSVHLVAIQILDEHLLMVAVVSRAALKPILSILRLEHFLLVQVLLRTHATLHLLLRCLIEPS